MWYRVVTIISRLCDSRFACFVWPPLPRMQCVEKGRMRHHVRPLRNLVVDGGCVHLSGLPNSGTQCDETETPRLLSSTRVTSRGETPGEVRVLSVLLPESPRCLFTEPDDPDQQHGISSLCLFGWILSNMSYKSATLLSFIFLRTTNCTNCCCRK